MALRSSSPDAKLATLRRLPLFAGAGRRGMEDLGRLVELQQVLAGTTVQREGDRVRHWLYVVDGALLRSRHGRPAGMLRRGASWGAPLLAGRRPSPESLDALEPCRILWVEARSWDLLLERFPAMAPAASLPVEAASAPTLGPPEPARATAR